MKYDSQITELKNLLPTAKNILIALPANANIDKLSAGLALFLILEAAGKEISIVCEDTIRVGQSYLFGIDHVQKTLPSTEGGNLTISLEGVASSDGTIPALEKLDWFAQDNNLNLVFHVLSGQTFQPTKIVPHYQGSGFNLVFVIGAANLDSLGSIYRQNQQKFSGVHIVNIDTQSANTGFGQTNVLDTNASCLAEVMANLIADLGYSLDADTASNLLAGVFESTTNLTNPQVNADTYMVMANLLRAGGKKPSVINQPGEKRGLDLSSLIPPSPQEAQVVDEFVTPSVTQTSSATGNDQIQPSPEERPAGERVVSETPEPDWLTPKIFKGSSLG
ncbi:MAG: hypothetical protein Q8P92_05605 [Candidatus Daviesbacteria bacterium]|nr:hypothetical protein [Candidatus Daviesbacteria bacterium]